MSLTLSGFVFEIGAFNLAGVVDVTDFRLTLNGAWFVIFLSNDKQFLHFSSFIKTKHSEER